MVRSKSPQTAKDIAMSRSPVADVSRGEAEAKRTLETGHLFLSAEIGGLIRSRCAAPASDGSEVLGEAPLPPAAPARSKCLGAETHNKGTQKKNRSKRSLSDRSFSLEMRQV